MEGGCYIYSIPCAGSGEVEGTVYSKVDAKAGHSILVDDSKYPLCACCATAGGDGAVVGEGGEDDVWEIAEAICLDGILSLEGRAIKKGKLTTGTRVEEGDVHLGVDVSVAKGVEYLAAYKGGAPLSFEG